MAERLVVVDGDIDILWRFTRARAMEDTHQRRDTEYQLTCSKEAGGAVLLATVLDETFNVTEGNVKGAAPLIDGQVAVPEILDLGAIRPGDPPYWHKYFLCEGFPRTRAEKSGKDVVWRVRSTLGLFEAHGGVRKFRDLADNGKAQVIVIEDSNTGYRRAVDGDWCTSLCENSSKWLVLKSTYIGFAEESNKLWRRAKEWFDQRIILILTVADLRVMGLQISRRLSWERTIAELVREFRRIWSDLGFKHCAHIVVSFVTAGAVVLTPSSDIDFTVTLYYDPRYVENDWSSLCDGAIAGYTLCLTVGVTIDLLGSVHRATRPAIARGVVAGITAARQLLLLGYGNTDGGLPKQIIFPATDIAESFAKMLSDRESSVPGAGDLQSEGYVADFEPASRILEHTVPLLHEVDEWEHWTILKDRYPSDQTIKVLEKARDLAVGPQKSNAWIADYDDWVCPITSFGRWVSVDRAEIEALRAISTLIENYVTSPMLDKPISLAVFGLPGNGKSFAIKEVASAVARHTAQRWITDISLTNRGVKDLTFNLSEFTEPEAITHALHQVRDIGLSGFTPLVFGMNSTLRWEMSS